jgi:hypothetical protein
MCNTQILFSAHHQSPLPHQVSAVGLFQLVRVAPEEDVQQFKNGYFQFDTFPMLKTFKSSSKIVHIMQVFTWKNSLCA